MNNREKTGWNITTKELALMVMESVAFIAQIVLCLFFYNQLGTVIFVYLGWAIFFVAMIIGWQARVAFENKGGARAGEGLTKTRVVVTSGIYGIVRHPMYLSFMLFSLALVLLSQHWLNAALGMIVIGILYSDMRREEQKTLVKFGDPYQVYMKQVPRMNFLVGVMKYLQRRKTDEDKRE